MDLNRRPFQKQAGPPETEPMVTEPGNPVQPGGEMSIFDVYHRIGSELKQTLKAFENNNYYLANKRTKLEQELATLKKKRDHQKSTLIQLQVKSEELDYRKLQALKEFARVERGNLDILNSEFLEVRDNDQCLGETHEKIKQLLADDKVTVLDAFVSDINTEYELQVKASEDYKQDIEKSFAESWEKIRSAIAEEKKLDSELDEAVQKCKNHTGLKEKYEYELQEKFSNLKLIENEAEALKIKIRKCKETLEVMSKENDKLSEELVKTVQVNSVELRVKDENVEKLRKDTKDKFQDLSDQEAKLNEATEEHTFLVGQVRSAEKQVEAVTTDIEDLNAQISELNKNLEDGKSKIVALEESIFSMSGIPQVEKDVSNRKSALEGQVAAKNIVVSDLDKKLASLEEKWVSTKSQLEALRSSEGEMLHRNENSKKELAFMLNGLKEARESTKLRKMERDLNDLKVKSATLKEQIREAEMKLETATREISRLEAENADLDREFQEANERDSRAAEKLANLNEERKKIEVLKTRIAEVRQHVRSIRASKEFSINIEALREQVRKVEQEIENENKDQESQREAIETTFKKTMSNLQEQIDKLKEASEEETMKRQAKIDRVRNGIPPLQLDIEGHQRETALTTQKNIEMMKGRLQLTGRLIERYKELQARSQTSDGRTDFTVMRMVGTIEEHLASSFRGMMDYLQMGQADMSRPTYAMFKRTLTAFEERFSAMTSPDNLRLSDPTYLDELKNAAFCLFGLRRYSDTVAGSDSTFFSPSSSNFPDF